MTTHSFPAKLTTTDRCTSRPSAARFFSRGCNGAEEPNVAEVASRALMRHPSARAMHNCFSGKTRETRCGTALSQYSTE
ncbi:hypothetical protein FIBSPDRAFT_879818 [Athelia psychrophila]|uniref:Uncharacterized protein n=1 Tax=Athelia psychrophila TaxID=1759441 RepID=A0A167TK24_9AGAM|nr:hypothetical protein FIBSPDRAFT_879818 [Fibularhizoctonia sp. CBS 109695]